MMSDTLSKSEKINEQARKLKAEAAHITATAIRHQQAAMSLSLKALEYNSRANNLFAEGHLMEKGEIILACKRKR